MTWTAVATDAGIADLFNLQTLGYLSDPLTTVEDIGDLGINYEMANRWTAVSSTSATWAIVYRHGDFGEDSTFGGESFGGTAWTTVAKAT